MDLTCGRVYLTRIHDSVPFIFPSEAQQVQQILVFVDTVS